MKALNTLEEEKHFAHAMMNNPVRKLLFGRFGFDVWQLPVCEKCEGYSFWDKGGVGTCPKCGYTTKKPITVQEFYEQGHHNTAGKKPYVLLDREKVKRSKVATVYGGEAGMPDENKKIIIAGS